MSTQEANDSTHTTAGREIRFEADGTRLFARDLGVFAVVVGATLLILTALAHQSIRAHRYPGRSSATEPTGSS